MDISKLSDIELKSMAYDELAKLEIAQKNLQIINGELRRRTQVSPEIAAAAETTK